MIETYLGSNRERLIPGVEDYIPHSEILKGLDACTIELGQMAAGYDLADVVLVNILNGATPTFDVVRANFRQSLAVDSINATSRAPDGSKMDKIIFEKVLTTDPNGKFFVLVEDLVDTGYTIEQIAQCLMQQGAVGYGILANIVKNIHPHEHSADNSTFTRRSFAFHKVANLWIAGWGMDTNGLYRERQEVLSCITEDGEEKGSPKLTVADIADIEYYANNGTTIRTKYGLELIKTPDQ
jgi:hypoxanthine-guanine phosphoribosyltransferase